MWKKGTRKAELLGPLLKYSKLVKVATAHNPEGRQSKTTQPSWVVVVVVCVRENQALASKMQLLPICFLPRKGDGRFLKGLCVS